MNVTPRCLGTLLVLLAGVVSLPAAPLRVLYFTKSSGYEHGVIKWDKGQPSYSERVLTGLGKKDGIAFTFSKDGSRFSPEYLAAFDVVMFYTSGDLTSVGTDGNPAMTAAGKQALLDWVRGGKGFVALHAGGDSFHTGEHGGGNPKERSQRYRNYGEAADPYVKMLGGEFIRHGPQQVATARVVDHAFPGFGDLGPEIRVQEEWYTLKDFAANDHVLLVMETKGMEGSDYQRPDYPLAWARRYGDGRVAYNAMGHREEVWDSAAFQSMLIGLLKWAAGTIDADVTANLEQVAPGHATIQPQPPPEPTKK